MSVSTTRRAGGFLKTTAWGAGQAASASEDGPAKRFEEMLHMGRGGYGLVRNILLVCGWYSPNKHYLKSMVYNEV